MLNPSTLFVILVLLSLLATVSTSSPETEKDYVRKACGVTHYRDICVRSLAPYSGTAKQSPIKWARAGVSVALKKAKNTALYLRKLKQHGSVSGRNLGTLLDCIECFQGATNNLHKSLDVLRKLKGKRFGKELGDLNTWMSAALTDEDTCLDGFAQLNKKLPRRRVLTATYITSNALALISRLGSSS